MDFNKLNPKNYGPSEFIKMFIRLGFIGISIGIISGTIIKSFQRKNASINLNLSLVKTKSISKELDKQVPKIKVLKSLEIKNESKNIKAFPKDKLNLTRSESSSFYPLVEKNPNNSQVKKLIQFWLKGKAQILAGEENQSLSKVARDNLVDIVNSQRQEDKTLQEFQLINAKINSITIKQTSEIRIEALTEIMYEDKRLKLSGQIIEQTKPSVLKINYILGKRDNQWELIDFFRVN